MQTLYNTVTVIKINRWHMRKKWYIVKVTRPTDIGSRHNPSYPISHGGKSEVNASQRNIN